MNKIDHLLLIKEIVYHLQLKKLPQVIKKIRLKSRLSNQLTDQDLRREEEHKIKLKHQQAKKRKQLTPEMKRRLYLKVLAQLLLLQLQDPLPRLTSKMMMMNILMMEKHFKKRIDRAQPELRKLLLAEPKNESKSEICFAFYYYIIISYLENNPVKFLYVFIRYKQK